MAESHRIGLANLRAARPTDDLEAVVRFDRDGLEFAYRPSFTTTIDSTG